MEGVRKTLTRGCGGVATSAFSRVPKTQKRVCAAVQRAAVPVQKSRYKVQGTCALGVAAMARARRPVASGARKTLSSGIAKAANRTRDSDWGQHAKRCKNAAEGELGWILPSRMGTGSSGAGKGSGGQAGAWEWEWEGIQQHEEVVFFL